MIKEKGLLKEWLDGSKASGEAKASRQALIAVIQARFGRLPTGLIERVEAADSAWCLANLPRVMSASRLEELGW